MKKQKGIHNMGPRRDDGSKGLAKKASARNLLVGNIPAWVWSPLIILAIHGVVFRNFLTFDKFLVFLDAGSDSYNQFYPNFIHNIRYLVNGDIPAWSFHEGMGQSVFPGGINNPFLWLLALFGLDHLAHGIVFIEIFKSLITGILSYCFFKALDLSSYTATVGAVLAAFLGYLLIGSSGWYGHSANVVYFIFLIYAFESFYQKHNRLLFPAAIFLIADNPFRLYLFSVFMFTYSIFRILKNGNRSLKTVLIFFIKLAGLEALGIGMGALFSYNSLLAMTNSPRVSGDVSALGGLISTPVFALADPLEAATLIYRFFSNDLLGTGSNFTGWGNYLEAPAFYCGLLTLLVFPQVFFYAEKKEKLILAGLFFFWMIPLVFPFFRYALYAFMGNYYKHGLSLFIPFLLIVYAACGLEKILAGKGPNATILTTTLLCLLLFLYVPFSDLSLKINNPLRWIIAAFLIVYGFLLYFLKFQKWKNTVKTLLLVALCMEIGYLSSVTINHRQALTREQFLSKVGYNDDTVEAVAHLKSMDSDFYRVNKDYPSSLGEFDSINDAKVHGYFGTPSYSSFNKQEYVDFLKAFDIIEQNNETKTRWAVGLLQRPLLQALCSVKYNLVKPEDFARKNAFYRMSYAPIRKVGDVMVMQHRYALPMGFTYDKWIRRDDFDKLSKAQKEIALLFACVGNEAVPGIEAVDFPTLQRMVENFKFQEFAAIVDQKRASAMRLRDFSQNHFSGEISLIQKQLVFFSIPFDKGWRAYDNGHRAPIIQTNIGFMGIVLDKGFHAIELRYLPPYIKPAFVLSALSLIIYAGMFIFQISEFRPFRRTGKNDRMDQK